MTCQIVFLTNYSRLFQNTPLLHLQLAEAIAPLILEREDFSDVKLLTTEFQYSPFDIIAKKRNASLCVFQVTTRTHTEIKRHLSYAKIFYLDFDILYVRPDLTGYILKYAEALRVM